MVAAMQKLWPLVVLLACLPGRVALAEAQPLTTYVGGAFRIYINRPTTALDGYRVDCGPSQPDCFLLNRAACDPNGPALPIQFTLSASGAGISVDASQTRTVYAFLSTTSSCIYSQVTGQTGNNPNLLIGTTAALPSGSIFFAGGTRPYVFPRDVDNFNPAVTAAASSGAFTTREMMAALGLCDNANGTATNLSTYFLCVGVDSSNKLGVNSGTNVTSTGTTAAGSDPTAYLQLQADTRAPEPPTNLTLTPRNARVHAEVSVDTSLLDVYQVNLRYTNDPQNLAAGEALDSNGQPRGCAAWQGSVGERSVNVYNQVVGRATFDVDGLDNDVDYGFCALSQDRLGNVGEPTEVQVAQPRFECDLFACYPGDLQTGYCGAGAGPQLWGAGGLLGVVLALRRRYRRPAFRLGGDVGPGLGPSFGQKTLGRLLLAAACATFAAPPRPAVAQDVPDGRTGPNRPRSEPPLEQDRQRPRGVESDAPGELRRRERSYLPTVDPLREELAYGRRAPRGPRWGAELRLAPYRPRVGGPAVQQTYRTVYAEHDGSIVHGRPLSYSVAGEWYATDRCGLIGPYLRLGFWRASGATRQCVDAAGAPVPCTAETVRQSTRGNDTGSLTMFPVSPGLVWRLDPWLQRLRLPVGAALNVGLDYVLWWARSGGQPSRYGAHLAQGATLGLHVGAQLSLQLDALMHAGASRSVAGTHLFAEYQYSYGAAIAGRHRRNRLDTSDRLLVAIGLGLRFY